jgi:hypothetical protein
MQRTTRTPDRVRKAGILGIGFDSSDGHKFITRGDDVLLIGGSAETHAEMQAQVARFQAELARRGKTLLDLTEHELNEIAGEIDP